MNPFIVALAKKAWANKLSILLAAVVIWLLVARFTSDRAARAKAAAGEKVFDSQAQELGAVKARVASAAAIEKGLTEANAKLVARLREKHAPAPRVVETVEHVVTIHDQAPGVASKEVWEDAYHRFRVDLASGALQRTQKFQIQGVVLEGPDGKTKLHALDVAEFDPVTGGPVPTDGVTVESRFEIVRDKPAVPFFHPRLLAVIGTDGYGGGVQLANWRDRVNLSGIALYQPNSPGFRIGATVGWRVRLPFFDSNLSVGPSYVYDTGAGKWRVGGVASIEVTR